MHKDSKIAKKRIYSLITKCSLLNSYVQNGLFSYLEKQKIDNISIFLCEDRDFELNDYVNDIVCGFSLKDYRFEKYKTISNKDHKISSLKIANKVNPSQKKTIEKHL